jgi:hypothetical protein
MAQAKPLFSAPGLAGKPPSWIDQALGQPVRVQGEYRDYVVRGSRVTVRFAADKAVAFTTWLNPPAKTARQAVSQIGLNLAKRKPAGSDAFRTYWRGSLGHPVFKEVAATKVNGAQYDLVVAKDRF